MNDNQVTLITGTSKGIGRFLVEHYTSLGHDVIGCSRSDISYEIKNYEHFCLDVCDEKEVKEMFSQIRRSYNNLDNLINNAGIASMNHSLLTPVSTVRKIFETNVFATFLFARESVKLMKKNKYGRIVNFSTVATKLKLEGESAYAASKAAVMNFTEILAREYAEFGVTVNAIAPTPVETDLIRFVPKEKIDELTKRLAIHRLGEFRDISNVLDFYISRKSDFVTGQTIFLGGI